MTNDDSHRRLSARSRRRLHHESNERRARGRDGYEHRPGGRDGGQPAQHGHRHGQRDHLAEPEARLDQSEGAPARSRFSRTLLALALALLHVSTTCS